MLATAHGLTAWVQLVHVSFQAPRVSRWLNATIALESHHTCPLSPIYDERSLATVRNYYYY